MVESAGGRGGEGAHEASRYWTLMESGMDIR
jgi:hypothetical protein